MQPSQPNLKDDELAKVERLKRGVATIPIDDYQLIIVEYGMYFGYEGMRAILDDKIKLTEVTWQLAAARKLHSGKTYDIARAVLAGAGAVNSKNPSTAFRKLTKDMINHSKADL